MAIRFEARETYTAPRERVFRGLTDLASGGEWIPGIIRIEPLTDGELRVGSRWRETRKMYGKEATEEFEVTELDAPRRFALRVDGSKGTSGRGEYLFTYDLRDVDGGTEVVLNGAIEGLSGVMRVMGKLFVGMYRKACAKDLVALKAHLENVA